MAGLIRRPSLFRFLYPGQTVQKCMRVILFALTFCWAGLGHAQTESQTLIRRAKPGDSYRYDIAMVFSQGPAAIEVKGIADERILSVEDGVLTSQRKLTDIVAQIVGDDQPLPQKDSAKINIADVAETMMRSRVTGEVLEIRKNRVRGVDYAFAMITSTIVSYEFVKPGDEWQRILKPKGLAPISLTYRADKAETVGSEPAMVVIVQGKQESKGSIEVQGKVTISARHGMPLKSEMNLKGMPLGAKGELIDLAITQTLRQP